jgi:hypothetical protein
MVAKTIALRARERSRLEASGRSPRTANHLVGGRDCLPELARIDLAERAIDLAVGEREEAPPRPIALSTRTGPKTLDLEHP